MKRIKRILSALGAVLLVMLYLATLICAIFDTSSSMAMFKASVMCTILIPILIWGYTVIYRLAKGKDEQELQEAIHQIDAERKQDGKR